MRKTNKQITRETNKRRDRTRQKINKETWKKEEREKLSGWWNGIKEGKDERGKNKQTNREIKR